MSNPIFCSSPDRNDPEAVARSSKTAGAAAVHHDQQDGASSIQPPGSPCDTVSSFGGDGAEYQGAGFSDDTSSYSGSSGSSGSDSELGSLDSDSDSEDGAYGNVFGDDEDCGESSFSDFHAADSRPASSVGSSACFAKGARGDHALCSLES